MSHRGCSVASYFNFRERQNTNLVQEIRAGVVSFLTLSYILLVNGQLLQLAGIPTQECVFGTALASAVGCFIGGLFGNLPFGFAPGLGLSAYLAYGLVHSGAQTKQQALTSCFIVGVMLGVAALTGLSRRLMDCIPRSIKLGTVVGMGLQIALIGLKASDLVVSDTETVMGLGSLMNIKVWVLLVGLLFTGSLLYHQVPGSILIGVSACTTFVWWATNSWPSKFVEVPALQNTFSENIDFLSLDGFSVGSILTFLFVGLFDVSGVIFGMGNLAGIMDEKANVPGSVWGFLGCSAGTLIAAVFGCSPIIIGVESAAGIKEGGKTGVTALVTGLFFFLSIFFAPVLGSVPEEATAPVLVLVGAMMMGESKNIDWTDMGKAFPAYITIVMMPFTFSIANGVWFGIASACILFITTGKICAKPAYVTIEDQSRNGQKQRRRSALANEEGDLVMHPTFLLRKEEADKYDIDTAEASKRSLEATNPSRNNNYFFDFPE